MLPPRKAGVNLQNLNIHVGGVCKVTFSLLFKKGGGIWLLQPYPFRMQSDKKCESFGNERSARSSRSGSYNHFHCTYMDDQFLSTSLFFLNSRIICLMLKMASVLYVISILTWHHQLPLMTLRTISFLSPPSLQLQDPDVRFRNAFSLAEIAAFSLQSLSWWLLWNCQQNRARSHQRQDSDVFVKEENRVRNEEEKHISYASNYKPGKWQAASEQIALLPIYLRLIHFPLLTVLYLPGLHLKSAAEYDEGFA